MSRQQTVQECDHAIAELLPDLPRPEQKGLAALVSGVVLAGTAVLSRASAAIPGQQQDRSKQQRAHRLLANDRLDVGRAQRRLVERVVARRTGRLPVLVDAVTTGATAHHPGTMTLMVALAWHHRALPVLWRTWRTDQKGQAWGQALRTMLTTLAELLPAGLEVVVLADRGLSGEPLIRTIEEQGWQYLLRVKRDGTVCHPGGVCRLGELVPTPGTQQLLTAAAIWPPTSHHRPRWNAARHTNIVAVWRSQDPEAWLLVTDLPASTQRCTEYRIRTWEEELFRELKTLGWQWNQSRVREPERVERLLLVMALATLWMAALGQRVVRSGWRSLVEERSRRCYSYIQLGRRWVNRLIANEEHVPCILRLYPQTAAPLKLS